MSPDELKAQALDRAGSVEPVGIGFSLHSDFMVTDPNPLHVAQMAATRRTWKEPDLVLAPQELSSVESAIRAVTGGLRHPRAAPGPCRPGAHQGHPRA